MNSLPSKNLHHYLFLIISDTMQNNEIVYKLEEPSHEKPPNLHGKTIFLVEKVAVRSNYLSRVIVL